MLCCSEFRNFNSSVRGSQSKVLLNVMRDQSHSLSVPPDKVLIVLSASKNPAFSCVIMCLCDCLILFTMETRYVYCDTGNEFVDTI